MDSNKIKMILTGKFTWKRLIRSGVIGIILIYLGLIFIGVFMSDKMMFPVPKASYSDTSDIAKIALPDGTTISARFYPIENPDCYIIYNHGNALDIGMIDMNLRGASKILNCSIISYDYPGYGTSEGKPTESSIFAAADATYAYLKAKGIDDSKIIIWGRSVGSGPATHLAHKYPVAGLFLESPFKSAFTVISRVPILPFDKFNNISMIDKINCPLLIMHGTDDRVISFPHGEALYATAHEPKSKLWVNSAGHNNLAMIAGLNYWNTIKKWIKN